MATLLVMTGNEAHLERVQSALRLQSHFTGIGHLTDPVVEGCLSAKVDGPARAKWWDRRVPSLRTYRRGPSSNRFLGRPCDAPDPTRADPSGDVVSGHDGEQCGPSDPVADAERPTSCESHGPADNLLDTLASRRGRWTLFAKC